MQAIKISDVQSKIEAFYNKDMYLHLETTNGAYAMHNGERSISAGAYIRNGKVRFSNGKIVGEHSFRVGLQIELGWIYAEGLTDYEITETGQLLLAGHDSEGKVAVALELSDTPFS